MKGRIQHLVAYADTDAAGVMYHGRYVELAERSRLLALHEAGWPMSRVLAELGLRLAVHRLEALFRRPARPEQWLVASTYLKRCDDVRCVMRTLIEHEGELLVSLDAVWVAVAERQPVRWPLAVLHSLQHHHVTADTPSYQKNSMRKPAFQHPADPTSQEIIQ